MEKNMSVCICGSSSECDVDGMDHFNRMRAKDNIANGDDPDDIFAEAGCDGFCEPMCSFCNRLADIAAEGRVIDQGY